MVTFSSTSTSSLTVPTLFQHPGRLKAILISTTICSVIAWSLTGDPRCIQNTGSSFVEFIPTSSKSHTLCTSCPPPKEFHFVCLYILAHDTNTTYFKSNTPNMKIFTAKWTQKRFHTESREIKSIPWHRDVVFTAGSLQQLEDIVQLSMS